jgi:hypothetical protein
MLLFFTINISLYFANFPRNFINLSINLILLLDFLFKASVIPQGQKRIKIINLIFL